MKPVHYKLCTSNCDPSVKSNQVILSGFNHFFPRKCLRDCTVIGIKILHIIPTRDTWFHSACGESVHNKIQLLWVKRQALLNKTHMTVYCKMRHLMIAC